MNEYVGSGMLLIGRDQMRKVRNGSPGRLVGGAWFLNGFIGIGKMICSRVLENKRDFVWPVWCP
jgi:hypothetical protein